MNHCVLCARTIAERDELAEQVRQLLGLLHDDRWVPVEWRLGPDEVTMLNVLVRRRLATRDAFMTAIYGTDPDGGAQDRIIDVRLVHMRRKLQPFGITIRTIYGEGFCLDDASRALLVQLQKAAV